MKYENVKEILPDDVLKLVQKYAAGKLLYIPIEEESKSWGEISGTRKKLMKRNQMICNKYRNGSTISELADEYFLSLDSIKKILYSKKDKSLEFTTGIISALNYASQGMLEEWIETYLMNYVDSNHFLRLIQGEYICFGIVKLPIRLAEQTELIHVIEERKAEVLIVRYESMRFYIDYQTSYFEELLMNKINTYPSIIVIRTMEDYKVFMKHYGRHFILLDSPEKDKK